MALEASVEAAVTVEEGRGEGGLWGHGGWQEAAGAGAQDGGHRRDSRRPTRVLSHRLLVQVAHTLRWQVQPHYHIHFPDGETEALERYHCDSFTF